jgi:hypothetical protein
VVSNAKSASGGAVAGVVLAIAVIIGGAMCDWYDGAETPVPCTSADWKAYAPQCNRFSQEPTPVIVPQK